ncbi:MAG: hypothetical protein COB17_00060 [Sulfurimonas sp.]|nr:MAG: hypothetical protein COB17_10210 [Sulfurimonas sp.]PHS59594.1 MAG: hypothetical protein COB17_00060 [Sulfurimonas sp.]
MAQSCPIAFKHIDGNLARIGAFFVLLCVLGYLVTSMTIFLYILALDFSTRLYWKKEFSIIYQLSKILKKILKVKTYMTDAGAKRLAAQFGLQFSIILIIEAQLGLDIALNITAFILISCASLELLFDYCIGCKVYHIIKKVYPNFHT